MIPSEIRSLLDGTAALEPAVIGDSLDREGFMVTPPLIDAITCAQLAQLYAAPAQTFRSTVTMARHGFGSGEYKYFARPLPDLVAALHEARQFRQVARRGYDDSFHFQFDRCTICTFSSLSVLFLVCIPATLHRMADAISSNCQVSSYLLHGIWLIPT